MVERVREVVIEKHGNLKLVVGGKHGYVRVRGGQGSTKDQYQGYTVDKKHFTAGYIATRSSLQAARDRIHAPERLLTDGRAVIALWLAHRIALEAR